MTQFCENESPQTAAAAMAQLYFVSVCVCTVYTLLPSRTSDLCVYTLETFMSVYMEVLGGVLLLEQADVIIQLSVSSI